MITIMWLFGIYIAVESFCQFAKMDKGDKLCRLAKYINYVVVGFVGIGLSAYYPNYNAVWLWVIPNTAIALTLWPTTYARATGGFKNRIGD